MRIGVTGQIGAGKTTAARILEEFGAYRIDADEIGRRVVELHPPLVKKLKQAFGTDIVNSSGNLKRRLVAQRAFRDDESRDTLNQLVHSYLLRDLIRELRQAEKKHRVVIVDAALIFDWGLESELDLTIVIYASRQERLQRLAERGVDENDARSRQSRQLPFAEYRKRADVVIPNRGSKVDLRRRLARVWKNRIAKIVDR